CCPTFIVGIAGPQWLVILGAAFPGFPIVQRLTDYIWLGITIVGGDEAQVDRVAHILHALKISVDDLRLYYETLGPKPPIDNISHPRFFLSITSYSYDGVILNLTYIAPLEPEPEPACITFLAQEDEGRVVVVKFVHRYGRDGALPQKLKAEVKKGLDAIHSGGFVYGDLRRPNIMVEEQGNGNAKIKFIDFDWAGEEGQVRYPPYLAPVVVTASRGTDYDLITQKHDVAMFN
ncbi:hypothetical protein C8J56DRAFT_720697, partial [Mycena floridula]